MKTRSMMIDKLTPMISQNMLTYMDRASEGYEAMKESVLGQFAKITSQYRIRKIREKDNHVVRDLIKNILLDKGGVGIESMYYDRELDSIYEFYNVPNNHFCVLTYQKDIIGTMGITKSRHGNPDLENCELKKFYLKKEFRGQGKGRFMLKSILNEAYYLGYENCIVRVPNNSPDALKFFEYEGFSQVPGSLIQGKAHETILSKKLTERKDFV